MLHSFRCFPKASDRLAWDKVAGSGNRPQLPEAIVAYAESVFSDPVPVLTAEHYMDFVLNGNRTRYEDGYFSRRRNLEGFVLAECLEHKGRYIGRIVEYIWAILGEPTWCVPAHAGLLNETPDPLPPSEREVVDLFNAETAMYVAETLQLLGDELSAVSCNLTRRMRNEVVRRVVVPVEQYLDRFHWKAGENNWTPWICSNLLWASNVVLADDAARFNAFAELLMPCVENYYCKYPEDGACDEGIGYWNLSPAKYFMFCYGIFLASDGAISHFGDEKTRRMLAYLTDSWCWNNEFVRFCDCGGRHCFQTGLIRKMAELADVPEAVAVVDRLEGCMTEFPRFHTGLISTLFELFTEMRPVAGLTDGNFSVYPKTQQLFTRGNGHFIAIKGGSNCEGHNHNDVGQFVLGGAGRFMALDLGSEKYTRQTFSERRYELFPQSGFSHNALVFSGVPQQNGEERRTSVFEVEGDAERFTCRMELSRCYPETLGLTSYFRTLSLVDGVFTVRDEWRASAALKPTMTILHQDAAPGFSSNVPLETVPYPLYDDNLVLAWGNLLYKSVLTAPEGTEGTVTLKFDLNPSK